MCNFFSCIVTDRGEVFFTESDSHETAIARMPKRKDYVRIEYNENGYIIDNATIPEWYERMAAKAKADVIATYKHVEQARAEYDKIEQQAWAEYDKIKQQAWAEYDKIKQQARAEYDKIEQQALAEYEKIEQQALAEYEKIKQQAWAEYDKIEQQARAEYVHDLEKIEGYLPTKDPSP